ncbi:acyltransferase [Pseudanabaena biceps]|nr:acyltransferase [Pseudanabaena biceps]
MTWELSELLRAIATTIVIGIHASHSWWFGVHDTTSINPEIFINTAINQVGRFTVPIFVVISGFALAKSEDKRPFDLQIFFQRRLWRILPPYILFSLLNVIGQLKFRQADWLDRLQQIWQALSTGIGDYHLYFLGIIFQCYLFYPLLRRLSFTAKRLYLLLTIYFLLFSWSWLAATLGYFPNLKMSLPDGNHLLFWLPYFQIGIWLAKDQGWTNKLVLQWRSRTWGCLFMIAAIAELSEFYWAAIAHNSAEAIGHYTRPSVFLMSLTFLLWSISWQTWQIKTFSSSIQISWQNVQPQIKTFAQASFITYLIHVWILRLITPFEMMGGLLFVPLAIFSSWIVGLQVWTFLKKI